MAKQRQRGSAAAGFGVLAVCCLAVPTYHLVSDHLSVVVPLLAVMLSVGLTYGVLRRLPRRPVRPARLSGREIAAMRKTAERKRRSAEAGERKRREAERIDALAQRFGLPNPTVEKHDAEEAERLRRVSEDLDAERGPGPSGPGPRRDQALP